MLNAAQHSLSASLTSGDPLNRRIVWADNAKAILIILVVLGHMSALDAQVRAFIYAFHLPAFLFISGFFIPARISERSFMDFCRKYIFPFIRLYLFVMGFSVLLWWGAQIALGRFISPLEAIWNGLYGTQWEGHLFIHKNGPLWYLPFLVCSLLAFYAATRLPVWAAILFTVLYFSFAIFYTGYPLPWSAGAGGIGLFFILAGFWFRQWLDTEGARRIRIGPYARLATGVLALVIVGVLSFFNGATNINLLDLGNHVFLYIPAAIAGIAAVVLLSGLIPHSRLADGLSTHSLLIFCIHIYAVNVVSRAGLPDLPAPLDTLALAIIAIGIAYVSMLISRLIMPWVTSAILQR